MPDTSALALADAYNIDAHELVEAAIDQYGYDYTLADLDEVAQSLSA